jgi:hypothetical protein
MTPISRFAATRALVRRRSSCSRWMPTFSKSGPLRIGLLLLQVLMANVALVSAKPIDHLLSFTYAFDKDLRPLLDKKLLVTPADCGRMIRMHGGPEVGELAVSVYCNDTALPEAQCHVTLTRAQSNMDYTFAEHRRDNDPLRFVRAIRVTRKDAAIPRVAATTFRDCLRLMIPEPGDPNRLHPLTISDNDRVEFWLVEAGGRSRRGERPEQPGKKVTTLIGIGDLLVTYCEVGGSERAPLLEQIDSKAHRLLRSLRR